MALTQDQLDQLHTYFSGLGSGGSPTGITPNGMTYSAVNTTPSGVVHSGEDSSGDQNILGGYSAGDPAHQKVGDSMYDFDAQGNYKGTHLITPENGTAKDLAEGLATVAAAYFGGSALGGMMSGAGAAADAGLSGMDLAADGGANSIFSAGGVMGSGGAAAGADAYGGASGMDLAADGGANGLGPASSGMDMGTGTFNAAADSQLASDQLGLTAADTTAGGVPSVGGAGNAALGSAGGAGLGGVGGTGLSTGQIASGVGTLAGGGAGAGSGGSGGGSGGTGGGGPDLSGLLSLLGGAYGMNQQNQASQQMLDYLKSRQDINDNMYKPGSPEANALWDQMSRKDAAAGRNSQYGPRSVDLAARIAQLKMDANTKMTTGIGNLEANAINQGSNSYLNMLPGLQQLLGGGSSTAGAAGSIGSIINWLSKNYNTGSGSNGTNVPGTVYDQQQPYNPGNNPADPNLDDNPDANGSIWDTIF